MPCATTIPLYNIFVKNNLELNGIIERILDTIVYVCWYKV